MKTINEKTYAAVCNMVAWIEVNRTLRPKWVEENFKGFFIQNCKVFKTNSVASDSEGLGTYAWNSVFKAKNIRASFGSDGKLLSVEVSDDGHNSFYLVEFIAAFNSALRNSIRQVSHEGLPSSVTDVLIGRLDRVKHLGYNQPDNVVVIDMRKLDSINFKTKTN